MYDEELFQEFLKERTKISNKGKRINTERAVNMLRGRLKTFYDEGYDCDQIINKSLDEAWIGLFRLKDVEPKQKHLTAPGPLFDIAKTLAKKKEIPRAPNPQKQRAAVEAMRQILNENSGGR